MSWKNRKTSHRKRKSPLQSPLTKTRKKVLVTAFVRSLRDPFVHARNAALMALTATSEFYEPEDIATKIIPSISHLLIDKEKYSPPAQTNLELSVYKLLKPWIHFSYESLN